MAGTDNNLSRKQYYIKVFKPNGDYIGVYRAVRDKFEYSQPINSAMATTTIVLAKSADTTIEVRSPWVDHNGNPYTDHAGNPYTLTSRTSNTVGPDTDVMNGHLIEVWAVYGRFEPWVDHMGRQYTDHTGDPYMLSVGAPNGRRVFCGKIVNYKANYGQEQSVTVTVNSHGMDLTRGEVIKSGSATTVNFASTPIENIAKYILDNNPTKISYTTGSIATTGVSIAARFQLNTKLEGIKSIMDQTPAGWWWYVNPADNLLYIQPRNTVADHTFIIGKHLETVEIEEDASEIRNKIYFVGGEKTDGSTLYKVYQDTAAIADHGLGVYTITDRRFTVEASAQRYAEKIMSRYASPVYTSTIRVSAATYDIENIHVGQMVGFRNAKTEFINKQLLQIVNRKYHPDYVELQLGEVLDDQKGIVVDLEQGLANEQHQDIPTTPS